MTPRGSWWSACARPGLTPRVLISDRFLRGSIPFYMYYTCTHLKCRPTLGSALRLTDSSQASGARHPARNSRRRAAAGTRTARINNTPMTIFYMTLLFRCYS